MKPFTAALTLIFASSLAFAQSSGTPHSAGGDVLVCPGRQLTLDYHHATLKTLGPLVPSMPDIGSWNEHQMIEFFRGRLKGSPLLAQVDQALEVVGLVNDWILADFANRSTAEDPYVIPTNCQRVKGSSRYSNATFIDPSYTRGVNRAELGILRFREALFHVAKGFESSEFHWANERYVAVVSSAVRDLIRSLMILDTPQYVLEKNIVRFTEVSFDYHRNFQTLF
ncbi:MAG TPA: hypothetical protein VM598_08085, partial [Bdellovibrionota bacterium]|nr:hypothetical protein [Bdellovibrionota bacterium]